MDPTLLYQELIRQYKAGNIAGATELALRLVEIKYESHGEHDPEYAAALSHYSLLLQAGGDLEGALEGLREVLEVRRESLGDEHPTVALTLSQLGMLLVESRNWEEAEAPFLESVAIRRKVLGENHPSIETDLKMLAMLAERSKALQQPPDTLSIPLQPSTADTADSPQVDDAPSVSIAEPVTSAPAVGIGEAVSLGRTSTPESVSHVLPRSSNGSLNPPALILNAPAPVAISESGNRQDVAVKTEVSQESDTTATAAEANADHQRIKTEMRALAGSFTRIGEGMSFIGQRMKTQGFPPNPQILYEATACHRKFASLCDEAIRRAEELELDLSPFVSPGEDRFSLPDLTLLFEEIFRTEDDAGKNEVARKTALAVIARVLELTHVDSRKQAMLAPVLEQAEALQTLVKESPRRKPPTEAIAILEGSHPLSALDRLVMASEKLDDDTWTRLFELVAKALGKRVATAAARHHLQPLRPRAAAPVSEDTADGSEAVSTSQQQVTDLMDSLIDDEDFMPARASREALARRIVIPDSPSPLKRPILGSAPRANAEEAVPPTPAQAKPIKVSQPAPPSVPKPTAQRPGERQRDPFDFLRTQTSIITQC